MLHAIGIRYIHVIHQLYTPWLPSGGTFNSYIDNIGFLIIYIVVGYLHYIQYYEQYLQIIYATLSFSEVIWSKYWKVDVGILGLLLQSCSSRCLVLILHRELGSYFLSTRKGYSPTLLHIHKTYNESMFDMYQQIVYSLMLYNAVLL